MGQDAASNTPVDVVLVELLDRCRIIAADSRLLSDGLKDLPTALRDGLIAKTCEGGHFPAG